MSSPPTASPIRFPRKPAACGSPTVRATDFSRSEMTSLYSTIRSSRGECAPVEGHLKAYPERVGRHRGDSYSSDSHEPPAVGPRRRSCRSRERAWRGAGTRLGAWVRSVPEGRHLGPGNPLINGDSVLPLVGGGQE